MRRNDEIWRQEDKIFKQLEAFHIKSEKPIKVVHPDGSPAHVPEHVKQFASQHFERFRRMFGLPEGNFTRILIVPNRLASKSQ